MSNFKIQPGASTVASTQPPGNSLRERFFDAFKNRYPNCHAVYLTTAVVLIWSGIWFFADTWARGSDLMAPGPSMGIAVVLRHAAVLLFGLAMLWIDDKSLSELVLMKKTESEKDINEMNAREKFFHRFKTDYPNLSTIYTVIGIIFAWCGIWGLAWDIPLHPFYRSILSILLGFFLLYVDDLKLDEI